MSGTLAELTGCLGGVKERGGMTRSVRSRYALCFCLFPTSRHVFLRSYVVFNYQFYDCLLLALLLFLLGHFLFALTVLFIL